MQTQQPFKIGIIGGSGLGEQLIDGMNARDIAAQHPDTPFGKPSAPILLGNYHDVPVALLKRHGDAHIYNPAAVPYRANIFALKQLGCTHIIASGATGSLREEIEPGDLVLVDQLIDKTDGRPRTFFENSAVHVEFAEPICPVMTSWLAHATKSLDEITVHDRGTYICMEGPAFSTRAESNLHRQWGGDLIGMTALPEARLAREAEIAYALIALPTDYDCWKPHSWVGSNDGDNESKMSLLQEIIGNLQRAAGHSIDLIRAALDDVSLLTEERSPAHDALALAIWSDKDSIDATEIAKLRPLWGRYFER